MSHLPQRKENNCLNCGAEVIGRFCHDCGQENLEPKESIWHLISHFFSDITHFDGKFFSSLKLLILKPGFLSKQYVNGRRAAYLNPIRMYLFTSAIFFLIFFSIHEDEKIMTSSTTVNGKKTTEIDKMDSSTFNTFTSYINNGKPMTREEFKQYLDRAHKGGLQIGGVSYTTRAQYDSALKRGKKHNWFERQIIYKMIDLNTKFKSNVDNITSAIKSQFIHSFPQMLFVLLPIFALILKLIYIRRKQFYYTDHIIFTIHLYIFIFILILASLALGAAQRLLHINLETFFTICFIIIGFFYFYKSLRNFYMQRRAKTILKFFILNFLFFLATAILFIAFFFFSVFRI